MLLFLLPTPNSFQNVLPECAPFGVLVLASWTSLLQIANFKVGVRSEVIEAKPIGCVAANTTVLVREAALSILAAAVAEAGSKTGESKVCTAGRVLRDGEGRGS